MPKNFSVGGFVKKPGRVPYRNGTTLLEAVNAAGGATPFASITRVELHRGGKKYVYNLRKPKHQQVRIFPGDSINVPQKHTM